MINRVLIDLYNFKPMQKAVKWAVKDATRVRNNKIVNILDGNGNPVSNLTVAKKHIQAGIGAAYTLLYFINGYRSKDIPPDRKRTLLINSTLCGIFGIAGGYALSGILDSAKDKIAKTFDKVIVDHPQKELLRKGFVSIVPLLGFTLIFRYFAPVIATPMADKISKFIVKHNKKKEAHFNEVV